MFDLIMAILGILVFGGLGYLLIVHVLKPMLYPFGQLLNDIFEPIEDFLGISDRKEPEELEPRTDLKDFCDFYLDKHLVQELPERFRPPMQQFLSKFTSHCQCFHPDHTGEEFGNDPTPWLEKFCSVFVEHIGNLDRRPDDVFLELEGNTIDWFKYADFLTWTVSRTSKYFGPEFSNDDPSSWLLNHIAFGLKEKYRLKSLDEDIHGKTIYSLARHIRDRYEDEGDERDAKKADPYKFFLDLFGSAYMDGLSAYNPNPYIDSATRFQHQHILAPTGSGKTTLLTMQLMKDFEAVKRGECSVIVMDTKRELVNSIAHLDGFQDKVISIDVEDAAYGYPVAFNILDLGARGESGDELAKEITRNSNISMLNYFFGSLMGEGAELTDRQRTVFENCLNLCLDVPNANIDTLIDIMENGAGKYLDYLDRSNYRLVDYFEKVFNQPHSNKTRGEIVPRLYGLVRNQSIARFFTAPSTKLDLYNELNSGKIILINAATSVLGEENVEVFGRFMIAMILFAVERRQFLSEKQMLQTFFYMDEAGDFIGHDLKLATMLRKVRGYKLGLIISHQGWSDIPNPRVKAGLEEQTKIKMSPSEQNYTFKVSCGNIEGQLATRKVSFRDQPQMSDLEYQSFLNKNREKYCLAPTVAQPELKAADPDPEYQVSPRKGARPAEEPSVDNDEDGKDFF